MIFGPCRRMACVAALRICVVLLTGPALSAHAAAALGRDGPTTSNPPDPNPASAPLWHWRLAGTLLGAGHRQAVFAQTNETRAVAEGQAIDGWTVLEVHQGGVTLVSRGNKRALRMEGFSPEEQAAAAAVRAEQGRRMDAAAQANLAKQETEIEAASGALAAATHRMQTQQ